MQKPIVAIVAGLLVLAIAGSASADPGPMWMHKWIFKYLWQERITKQEPQGPTQPPSVVACPPTDPEPPLNQNQNRYRHEYRRYAKDETSGDRDQIWLRLRDGSCEY